MGRSIVSPEAQTATFVELFFDLVFVFAITQMVALLHHDLSWAGTGKAILVFWMIWWAWTQFTWALNAANTTNLLVQLGTLVATALAFFMAVAVPGAFGDGALWFAVTYGLVRAVGLLLYGLVAMHTPGLGGAVKTFGALSVGGLACAVVGGVLGGPAQVWLWGLTIFLDFVAASVGGESDEWNLHPSHFAERHGLIVIIALGESLIVAAGGLVGTDFSGVILVVAVLAVLVSCGLWWTYFPLALPRMEHALAAQEKRAQSRMARDAYSFGHFPMLAGVIGYAVALEEALAHPLDALPAEGRAAMAIGLALFLLGPAFGLWRTTCGLPVPRIVVALATAAGVWALAGAAPVVSLAVALAGIAVIVAIDERGAARLRADLR